MLSVAKFFYRVDLYRLDLRAEPKPHALLFQQLHDAGDDRAGAAHGELDAPLALEVLDERVDARRVERVAADEQRLEREDAAELVVADVLARHLPDGPPRAER